MWRFCRAGFGSHGTFNHMAPLLRAYPFIFMFILRACVTDSVRYPNTTRDDADIITAYLSKPEGDGPFLAVLLLHGCLGLEREAAGHMWLGLKHYEAALNDAGFVTLIVDSHGSRGKRMDPSNG